MRGKGAVLLAAFVTLCVLLYGGYRVARHYAFPQHGIVLADRARCVGRPMRYRLPAHPIVAFGDSITLGYEASRRCQAIQLRSITPESRHIPASGDATYPADLSRLVGTDVLDYGVSGETTRQGMKRLRSVLGALRPRTVIVLEGFNDIHLGQSPDVVSRRLERMVSEVRSSGARPLLLGLTPVGKQWSALGPRIEAVNRRVRGLTVRFPPSDLSPDGLHPDDAGYRVIARVVATALR